ncbi:3-hydroxylacyl-ACP dehydratase [uncultured Acinetobacter sp.]|uniref:ApeP family dehydratase n=1 Tax=uncultured Acinetobacter sp. TaxID=165433 RepID=UPI00258514B4|nr:3-hydroxylacyl-ACP dehydratase [uncultured Acinetobacter sp.]
MILQEKASQYIPHEAPMLLVDDLIEITDTYAVASLSIQPDLMFCTAQGLPTWISIELMAQTISAFSGYQGHLNSAGPKVGFLLGTRKLNLPVPFFALGTQLTIRVEKQSMHDGLGQFECCIDEGEYRICAVLTVYEPPSMTPEQSQI